jgi:hypothetical protein
MATTLAITTSRQTFPVFTVERITMRKNPIYHSTYTGKPPDEPAILGVALNEVFVPLLQKQYPEDRRFLPAARRLLVPAWPRSAFKQAVPRPRQARSCSASGASCASSCTPSSSS